MFVGILSVEYILPLIILWTLAMHFSQLLGKTYSLVLEMHKFCTYANLYY